MSFLLSDRFKILKDELCHQDFTVSELLDKMGDKSHAFAIVIFSLPFLLPIPLVGLSTVMGIIIAWIAGLWLVHKKIWVPKKWRTRMLPIKIFAKVFATGELYSRKIELLFKARGAYLFTVTFMRIFIFLLLFLSAFFLALPLPPGTNFPPAITLIFISLAIIYEDLVLLLIGIFIFAATTIITIVALKFVWVQGSPYFASFWQWLSA